MARCSIRLCAPPRLVARMNSRHRAATRIAASRAAAHLEREHAAERRHLPRRHFVSGMAWQSRIVHPLHRRCWSQQLRHPHRVLRLRAHPPGQRIDAAQRQPAIERRRHRAAVALRFARALEQVIVMPRDQRAADHVAVAADVLRRRVRHHVDAAIERPLQHRRGERAVAHRDHIRRRSPRQRRDASPGRRPSSADSMASRSRPAACWAASPRGHRRCLVIVDVAGLEAPLCRRPRRSPCAAPNRHRPAAMMWSPGSSPCNSAVATASPEENASASLPPSSDGEAVLERLTVGLSSRE